MSTDKNNKNNENDKKKIRTKEVDIANAGNTNKEIGELFNLRDANGVSSVPDPTADDPTVDDGSVVPSDDTLSGQDAAASEALNKGLDKSLKSASNNSSNISSASSSSSSDKESNNSSVESSDNSQASNKSSSKAPVGSDAAEQIAGNDKDAAENLEGNSPLNKAPFSINPANIQKAADTKMEHVIDICENSTKTHKQLSSHDMIKIYSLTRSSIRYNEQAFNILESQIHSTLQKVRDSMKVVNYKQEKISDADPKANLKMINEMAQRGIPQRFDKDVRILTRILRDDPYFQRYKQEHHLDTSIKPTKQFQAQTNKIKQENARLKDQKKANKSVKPTIQSRN